MAENIKEKNNVGVDWRNVIQRILSVPAIGPLFALIAAALFFYSQNDRFLSLSTISLILNQNSWIAVLAIGQTLIILTAGIDLSNGSAMAVGMVVTAFLAVSYEVPAYLVPILGETVDPLLALLAGFAVTIGFGFFNGFLVTQLNLPPFIVTLGTLNIAFAMTRLVTSTIIRPLPDLLTYFGRNRFSLSDLIPDGIEPAVMNMLGERALNTQFAYGIVATLVLYLIFWILLRETDFGRHIYAIGDDPEAARLMGIPVNRVLIMVYGLAGLTYALAGWLLLGRLLSGDPNVGQTANLDTITAVVIGGTSLFGGRGNILGTLIGALIVGVFITGLQSIGVPILYQRLITGVLVILAVALDQFSQRIR